MKTKTNDRLGLYRSLVVSLAEVMSQPSDLRLIVETEEFVSGDNNDYRYYMIDTVAGLEKNLGCGRYDGDDCYTMTYYAQYLYNKENGKYYTALVDIYDKTTWLDKRLGLVAA